MDKFTSQQAALRTAFEQVLGCTPKKGELVITDDQRKAVGELMMGWLAKGLWSIKDGTRAFKDPLNYIVGRQPTCLIQAWVKQPKRESKSSEVTPMDKIKMALEAGLITKEQAQEAALKLIAS